MKGRPPTSRNFEELLAFLPLFQSEGFKPIKRQRGGDEVEEGVITVPWPEYDERVSAFMRLAAGEAWIDRDYDPTQARGMLEDPRHIASASLPEVRTMLTFCVRGERFCDGRWAAMIKHGCIRRLLERLQVLFSSERAVTNGGSR